MALNDKLLQLKNNISSFKQDLASAISEKGGSVTSASTLDEMISSVGSISGGNNKWFDGVNITSGVSDENIEYILSNYDFSEVTDFSDWLQDRNNFTTFPSFNTSSARNLSNLFKNCSALTSLPYFDLSNAENVEGMLDGCVNLQDVVGFGGLNQNLKFVLSSNLTHDSLINILNNLATVSDKEIVIGQKNKDKLTSEEISIATDKGWTVKTKLPYVSGLFKNDESTTDEILENIFQGYETSNISNMDGLFTDCSNITTIPTIDTSSVLSMVGMFRYCSNLKKIPTLDTSNVLSMNSLFGGCNKLKEIPTLNTSSVTSMYSLFCRCLELENIPLLDTSNVTNFKEFAYVCKSITTFPKLNLSSAIDISYMFYDCSNLKIIPILNTSSATNMEMTFCYDSNLVKISSLDVRNVNHMMCTFISCSSLRYMLLKNIGQSSNVGWFMHNISSTKWGVEDSSIPESIGARQSMIDSMITYSFDRATAGYSPLTYELSSASKAVLTEEEIAAVTAKGYTIA